MKKLFFLLFLTSCISSNSLDSSMSSNFNFDDDLSYDDFYKLLIEYGSNKKYPNID